MKYLILSLLTLVAMLVALPGAVFAQDEAVTSKLSVHQVVNDAVTEEIDQSTEVEVGDTLEYRLSYTNNLDEEIADLKPVLPIPAGMKYLKKTAAPSLNAASLDSSGLSFQEVPITKEVRLESGEIAQRSVNPGLYKRLRWYVDILDPEETVTLSARVLVSNPGTL